MKDDKAASVVLKFPAPTPGEIERATQFWDRLHAEERARKKLRQGDAERWPFPSSGYDAIKTAEAERLANAWGKPVQRLDTETVAQKEIAKTVDVVFDDVSWAGDVSRETTKPDLSSWGNPSAVLPAVEEFAPITKKAWDSLTPKDKPDSKLCPPGAWGPK